MKNLICILYNKGKNNELTKDCQLRIKAGLKLKSEDDVLCFVGEETGLMKKHCPNERIIELNNCKSMAGNVREIINLVGKNNFEQVVIISNCYHLARIEMILRKHNLSWETLGAEEILGVKPQKSILEPIKYLLAIFLS